MKRQMFLTTGLLVDDTEEGHQLSLPLGDELLSAMREIVARHPGCQPINSITFVYLGDEEVNARL